MIHVHHGGGRDPGGTCDAIRAGAGHVIEYTDCEPLPRQTIEQVAAVSALGGKLLVHCAFGQCRGPTLALVALVARGVIPWHALHDVTVALWLRRRIAPHWCPAPLEAIFAWWGEGAPRRGNHESHE